MKKALIGLVFASLLGCQARSKYDVSEDEVRRLDGPNGGAIELTPEDRKALEALPKEYQLGEGEIHGSSTPVPSVSR